MTEIGLSLKHYDISMLRDFLDHLLCELQLARLEFQPESNGDTADLMALQKVYRKKYHTSGLLELSTLENDVESDEEFKMARKLFDTMISELRDAEISRLEKLRGLFDEALLCCGQDTIPVRSFSATELLENSDVDD